MKIGCIGYANNSGLGNYISNFRKHLPFDSQFVIKHPDKGTHPIDIPHTFGSITATEDTLKEYLDVHSPDVVVIIETPFNDAFFQILHDRGVKVVYVPMIDCRSVNVIKPFFPYIDVILNHTKVGHNLYKDVADGKAYYIPYPIDTEYFCPEKSNIRPYTFLHNQGVGGAGFRKATDQVFIAFRQAQFASPGATLLVNSQPYEHTHSQLLKDARNVTVKIQDYPEAIDIYRDARVYIAPSRREGLGLPVLEAMSCGLAVITTDAPPMNEWFEQDHLLVPIVSSIDLPYGDIPMVTPNIYKLFEKILYAQEHPKHMNRMGKANRKIIEEKFSWRVLKDEYTELFERIM